MEAEASRQPSSDNISGNKLGSVYVSNIINLLETRLKVPKAMNSVRPQLLNCVHTG